MTRTTRRVLFYCSIALFMAVSYIALVYAQGYQYSFSERKFVRSGALYVKANTSASVYLDGKLKDNTSLIGNSVSIGNLKPATYSISVEKNGWSSWQKKTTIVAGFVEDFNHVMLLPQTGQDKENVKKEIQDLLYPVVASASKTPTPTPSPTPKNKTKTKPTPSPTPTPLPTPDMTKPYYMDKGSLYVNVSDGPAIRLAGDVKAVPSEDGQKLAWFTEGQLWVYWFTNTNYQPVHYAGDVALVAHFNHPIKAIQWFRDNDHIALDAGGLKVIEIDTRPGLNIINF
ncbi:MAG: hypothetical protein KBC81_01210 [Candidatus Pacebacteria bacterium]|nr:hypothetical protein [Candidatus Paceibacterota bacterium]